MNPRLIRVLARIQRHFDGPPIVLWSGYRPVARGAADNYHSVAHAADIHIVGIADRDLFDYCRTLPDLGCGLYPNLTIVHVDVRSRSAIWVDVGALDDGFHYVDDPGQWIQGHPGAGRGLPAGESGEPPRRRRPDSKRNGGSHVTPAL